MRNLLSWPVVGGVLTCPECAAPAVEGPWPGVDRADSAYHVKCTQCWCEQTTEARPEAAEVTTLATEPTIAGRELFRPPPPSDLIAIVLAFKNGEADWPTTKTALVNFPYVPDSEPQPEYGTPEYAEWYSRDDGLVAAKANTLLELNEAAYTDKFEYDRYEEVLAVLWAKHPKDNVAPAGKP